MPPPPRTSTRGSFTASLVSSKLWDDRNQNRRLSEQPRGAIPRPALSDCAAHLKHDGYGPQEHQYISDQRPLPDVSRLERNDFLEVRDLVSARHLPRTGNARLHVKPRVVMR